MANLAGWPYWKVISITGQSGSGTDYQVELEMGDSAGGDFHLEGHCTNFPQDITITDDDGTTLLDHFVEDLTADPIVVHVEVKDDLGSNQTIRVYYGKSGETTASNGDNTFLFFDDFPGSSLDTSKWEEVGTVTDSVSGGVLTTTSNGYDGACCLLSHTSYGNFSNIRITAKMKVDVLSSAWEFGVFARATDPSSSKNTYSLHAYGAHTNFGEIIKFTAGSYSSLQIPSGDIVNISWHKYAFELYGTSLKAYQDNTLVASTTDSDHSSGRIGISNTGGSRSGKYDQIFVGKYNSPEPAFSSAGAEQSPTGWTGKILGVTNPTKINGIDVANIAKVMNI